MPELSYAIAATAGVLAVLNPCGFAMLPGYLSLLVATGGDDAGSGYARPVGRALATTLAMTGGFVTVFGGFGLAAAPFALSVQRYLPWVTVAIGLVLVVLGVWLLSGRDATLALPKPAPGAPARSLRWAAAYGASYALASLSCTIGPFLALVTSAVRSGSAAGAVSVFLTYAGGMGAVIGVLTVATALARRTVATRLRRALPYVTRASGALLVLAGAYVAYYGQVELRVLRGGPADDPVVGAATTLQSALARTAGSAGAGWAAAALLGLCVLAGLLSLRARRRAPSRRRTGP
ncbi:cytochrome c biogenesis protein CcdA [Haloactinospora alba]|uniref:Cytochrome c biogenesis protein CcdA n=1 Tax=Haloactinospora alba TaxID=405555 RepID=A0A543NNG6_9ACTN|nr:cytochrome c biogenesis protein CcdA [Haloactinospora alba]TQN33381.1 cytochrome c biogenesis protein CcdA [Haloactinospora alba]